MTTMLYSNRPAKAVQRRMLIETCRRLSAIAPLTSYQYVGFGGLEFNDFVDAHNALGITKMTSIERNDGLVHRIEFNKPYAGMTILMGEARDQLPLVDWRVPAIVWLDYMDPLSRDVLRDVEYVVRTASPGTFVAVTVQAGLGENLSSRVQSLKNNLDDLAPETLATTDVEGWGVADIQQEILASQVDIYSKEAHGSTFHQVLDIGYQDVARMTTWGGVISSATTARSIEQCRFDDLSFVRERGRAGLRIKVPDLTQKEWKFLEHAIGNGRDPSFTRPKGIDKSDVAAFADVYRYRAS